MAASSLLVLIDDIAMLLDDVSAMSKVAAKKTAGVLGDDLALNAQQVSGIRAERELPVVWAVAKGSLRNKFILVPAALVISALAPWAVTPLLMIGGIYLCFEGVEKLAHAVWHHRAEEGASGHEALREALADPAVDMVAFEREKVQGAVRTDFILSAEIVAITLGIVADAPLAQQVAVLGGVSLAITVGVYGLVAAIVKMDDLGLHLSQRRGALLQALGRALLGAAPRLMRLLSVAGTAAMFLVGGGILVHGLPGAHAAIHDLVGHAAQAVPGVMWWAGAVEAVVPMLMDAAVGVVAGAIALAAFSVVQGLFRRRNGPASGR
jgi:predicted DNA repair protein MutK